MKRKPADHTSVYCHPENRKAIDRARRKTSFSRYVIRAGVEKAGGEFYEPNAGNK